METLIPHSLLPHLSLYSFSSILAPTKSPSFIHSARLRYSSRPWPTSICCSTFSSPDPGASIYGGWEELEFLEETRDSGMLQSFRNFIISIGFDDRKHTLPFLLGFFAAFALSRVRFSTIALLPISLLAFIGGFGFAVNKLGRTGDVFGVFEEKLKHLEYLLSDVDGKMSYLRKGLERGVEAEELGMGVSESYLQIVEHVKATIGEAQKTLADPFTNDLQNAFLDFDFGARKVNQKFSRKKMELRSSGIDFFQFLSGVLEPLIGSKTAKLKDSAKEKLGQHLNPVDEKATFLVSDRDLFAGDETGECNRSLFPSFNPDNSMVEESGLSSIDKQGRIETEIPKKDIITNGAAILNSAKFELDTLGSDVFSFNEEIDNKSSTLQFMTSRGSFKEIFLDQKYKKGEFSTVQKKTRNTVYFRKSESSSLLEHTLDTKNRACEHSSRGGSSESSELNDKQLDRIDFAEPNATLVSHPRLSNQEPLNAREEGKLPYSSNQSFDEQFDHNVKEAMNLLKRARTYMMTRAGEEEADAILYKAAELLSSAVVMRPMSLIAVGQLGNVYLLHGELKLKITRELRTLLLRSDSLFSGESGGLRFKKFDNVVASREDIASVVVSACEECECLLVEAGRKYRSALSIDRNDVRALYNWGIALCFRAQLIADVGPEAAMDADKIYLAAIDKFNAMMSGSNTFAPDALYRWGMVLQHRAHLRPNNSREKEMLLHQAKSLFEDVLSMESENKLVKDALVSCIAELNHNIQV